MSLLGRRRRSPRSTEDDARSRVASTVERTRQWLPRLREGGWLLPPSLARDDVVPSTTRVGVVDGSVTSEVDSRGLVVLATHGLSVDWWIGAEDRWHLPAREAGVTQARIDGAPVVETTMRVPGGTVVHRVYGTRGSHYPGGDDWLVVEVENRSAVPVALAWAVRPLLAAAVGEVFAVELVPPFGSPPDSTGTQVLEAGGAVGLLPRAPSRTARRDDGTDPVHQVVAGEAEIGTLPFRAGNASGAAEETYHLASAALLVPLPHTATARIVLFPDGVDHDVAVAVDDAASGWALSWPADLPSADAVARGWTQLVEQGPRVELPDPVLAAAVAAARRSLPLAHRVRREAAASDQAAPPATHVVTTGVGSGPADPVGDRMEILAALSWWGEHDAVDRVLPAWPEGQQKGGGFGSPEATAAALRVLAVHAVAAGDVGPAQAWLPEVGGAIEHLGKVLRKPPPGTDLAAVAEGLDAGAVLLARLDQPEAAARIAADAATSAAGRKDDAEGAADLDAPSLTPRALAAAAVTAARDGAPSEALWALLRRASATWTWSDPERWVGDDGLVPARLLDAVARLLVADRPAGPAVLPWLPPSWWGRGWELHGAPTRWGTLSYAVRWHGDRPALLWELAGEIPGDPVVTAPGLDPAWSSRDRRGEALLAPVPVPPEVAAGESTDVASGVAVAAPPRSVWRPQDPGPDAPAGPHPPSSTPDPGAGTDPDHPDGGSFT